MGIMRYKYWIGVGASIFLGIIFMAAGLGKLLHQPEPIELFIFSEYLTAAQTKNIYIWLPRLELLIGLLLVTGVAAKLVAALSLPLIAGFITNNSLLLIQGHEHCPSCFGPLVILPTVDALCIDVGMLALALIILFCYQSNFFNIYPWFLRRSEIA